MNFGTEIADMWDDTLLWWKRTFIHPGGHVSFQFDLNNEKLREIIEKNSKLTEGEIVKMWNSFKFLVSWHLMAIGKFQTLGNGFLTSLRIKS